MIKKLVLMLLCISLVVPSFAQVPEEKKEVAGTRKQLAMIVFAGLGGAVLGLSTLSFYGRPQEYLSNIAIGFALGIIGGTVYVTYKAASDPKDFYGTEQEPTTLLKPLAPAVPVVGYRWSF